MSAADGGFNGIKRFLPSLLVIFQYERDFLQYLQHCVVGFA